MSSLKTILHPAACPDRTISPPPDEGLCRRGSSIAARSNSVVTWTMLAWAYVATCCCAISAGRPTRVTATKYSCCPYRKVRLPWRVTRGSARDVGRTCDDAEVRSFRSLLSLLQALLLSARSALRPR